LCRGVYAGSTRGGGSCRADRLGDRDAAAARGVAHDVRVGAGGEAGVGVAEVLRDLVQRAALVEQQRGAGVAEVVEADRRQAGLLQERLEGTVT
jgi:hypothetical protein